ncbi:DUF6692 family protein [Chelativorans salis]|uniref:DUF6692 domain-containing protein n=1 Tax=Chelativorans salis TaxID=2978478 RepID=A0ABT2LK50_9HYPH|nr:DUF6692 family protein [Chelativorans sp. EGI FJ00035]MCT7374976.1 hypothetical protein [Chelativorans sp. EGI FJ00035]
MRSPSPRLNWAYTAVLLAPALLVGCSESEAPDDELNPVRAHEPPRIAPAGEALSGAHIPTLDPATMSDAEIWKAIGRGAHCIFRYTSSGKPVLAVKALPGGGAEGVVKLNGSLVLLRSASSSSELVLAADEVRMSLATEGGGATADQSQEEATSVFEVGDRLKVGYRGYYRCVD